MTAAARWCSVRAGQANRAHNRSRYNVRKPRRWSSSAQFQESFALAKVAGDCGSGGSCFQRKRIEANSSRRPRRRKQEGGRQTLFCRRKRTCQAVAERAIADLVVILKATHKSLTRRAADAIAVAATVKRAIRSVVHEDVAKRLAKVLRLP